MTEVIGARDKATVHFVLPILVHKWVERERLVEQADALKEYADGERARSSRRPAHAYLRIAVNQSLFYYPTVWRSGRKRP